MHGSLETFPPGRKGAKKLGGQVSWRAVAPTSPCPMRLGGSLALPQQHNRPQATLCLTDDGLHLYSFTFFQSCPSRPELKLFFHKGKYGRKIRVHPVFSALADGSAGTSVAQNLLHAPSSFQLSQDIVVTTLAVGSEGLTLGRVTPRKCRIENSIGVHQGATPLFRQNHRP